MLHLYHKQVFLNATAFSKICYIPVFIVCSLPLCPLLSPVPIYGPHPCQVDDLQLQLEKEASRCTRLEQVNGDLKEQLAGLKGLSRSHERLERSKRQLEEELSGLRRQMESSVMDQSQAEQYRRETEERARQEIRHKLEEVNLFLQVPSPRPAHLRA